MKTIGYNEHFIMYILVDFKLSDEVIAALKAAKFQCSKNENTGNDDHGIRVTVTILSALTAHTIISNIIH